MRMLLRRKEKMAATIISPPSASSSLSSTYARLEFRSKCAWTSRNVIETPHTENSPPKMVKTVLYDYNSVQREYVRRTR